MAIISLGIFASIAPAGAMEKEKPFKVILLGTGSPQPEHTRASTSTLIIAGGQKIIIDAGRRSFQRIADALGPGMKVRGKISDLDKIFLTHLHSDHIQGIPDIFTTGFMLGRNGPLQVWGPPGTKHMMTHIAKAYEFDVTIRTVWGKNRPEAYKQVTLDIEYGFVWKKNDVSVRAILVDHKEIKPAYGYVVEFDGRKVVFSGDTIFTPSIIKASKGADLLVHQSVT
jgi:ribonuclease Z